MRFDAKTMQQVMTYPIESFESLGQVTNLGGGRWGDERHIYIDRGGSVLGVAHLDSVQTPRHFWVSDQYIACPTIDNRLGAWLVLYGLPSLGVTCDVLLTEHEEMCMSTARDFTPAKEYNWMFSFDRTGTDVVMYQYDSKELRTLLASYGFRSGYGSYSDIAELDRLGVSGFNFGCGMYNYHSLEAYVKVDELADQADRFVDFYHDNKEVKLPYTPAPKTKGSKWGGRWAYDQRYYDDEWDDPSYYTSSQVPPTTSITRTFGYRPDPGDEYEARAAISAPAEYFEGEINGDDWQYEHVVWPCSDPDMPDEVVDLYGEGVLVICDYCDNLFARTDARKYPSLNATLCKRCFYEFAVSDGAANPHW